MVFTVDVPDESYLVVAQNPAFPNALALYSACTPTDDSACAGYDAGSGRNSILVLNDSGLPEQYFLFSDATTTGGSGAVTDLGIGIYDPAAGGDTCATALMLDGTAVRASGGLSRVHANVGYDGDYNPSSITGCIGLINPNTAGRDSVFTVAINNGETLTASVTSLQNDAHAIYLLTGDCSNAVSQCADGDAAGGEVSYTGSVNNTNVFVVVDTNTNGTSDAGFILHVAVTN